MGITHNAKQVSDALADEYLKVAAYRMELVKMVAIECFKDLQGMSPIDTGRYRAGHRLTVGGAPTSYVPRAPLKIELENRAGRGELIAHYVTLADNNLNNAVRLALTRKTLNQVSQINIANNVPYATVLETGHSKQAPRGIYLVAAARAERRLREIAQGSGVDIPIPGFYVQGERYQNVAKVIGGEME